MLLVFNSLAITDTAQPVFSPHSLDTHRIYVQAIETSSKGERRPSVAGCEVQVVLKDDVILEHPFGGVHSLALHSASPRRGRGGGRAGGRGRRPRRRRRRRK